MGLIVQPTENCAFFYGRVFNFFSLFDFVYAINLRNKPYFLMPNRMSMVSAICLAGEVLGSELFVLVFFNLIKFCWKKKN